MDTEIYLNDWLELLNIEKLIVETITDSLDRMVGNTYKNLRLLETEIETVVHMSCQEHKPTDELYDIEFDIDIKFFNSTFQGYTLKKLFLHEKFD